MEKEFVPYEIALALKKLGFDEKCITKWCTLSKPRLDASIATLCFGSYEKESNGYDQSQINEGGYAFTGYKNSVKDHSNDVISAPLYQQVFKWFREKYGFVHTIFPADLSLHEQKRTDYACALYLNNPIEIIQIKRRFSNYYDAELACLEKLIEIVELKSE